MQTRTVSITPDARRRVLHEWNATRRSYPRESTIAALFEQQAALDGDATAVAGDGHVLSYDSLNRRSNQLAHCLIARGVAPETLVGVCMDRDVDQLVCLLAILKAGGAYVPLGPDDPSSRLRSIVRSAGIRVLLADEQRAPVFAPGTHVLCPQRDRALVSSYDDSDPAPRARAQNLAYVTFTSGSSGEPKGVEVEHRSVIRLVRGNDYARFSPDEVFLQLAPLAFDASTFEIWGSLLNGAALILMPPGPRSLDEIASTLRSHRVTTLWLPAALFQQIADRHLDSLRGVRQLLTGGDVVPAAMVRRVLDAIDGIGVINGYGPTESTTFACCHRMTRETAIGPSVPIGRPIANTTAYVLDATLNPVPIGVVGELWLGGDGLARGYLHAPRSTAWAWLPDPFGDTAGSRLYRTGDRVRYRPDGVLEFLGRSDHQIKIRGFRVEPGEVEETLAAHPLVSQAVVVPVGAAPSLELAAYVLPRGTSTDGEDVRSASDATRVRRWRTIYEELIYDGVTSSTDPGNDPTFNIIGWKSSYTGLPLSAAEMREQVDHTVERIAALTPRSVLEIGCGTGLLLFRLAPHVGRYVATDFASVAVDYVRAHLTDVEGRLDHVTLLHRPADDFEGLEPQSFDVVILNSVVQHFPSAAYLTRVLRGAMTMLRMGGYVFCGDVRSLPLLSAFHTSVQAYRSPSMRTAEHLRRFVAQAVLDEEELVLSPAFFTALAVDWPDVTDVRTQLKRGRHQNELTRFRYDVIIRVGGEPVVQPTVSWLDYSADHGAPRDVAEYLGKNGHDFVGIRGVPNGRIAADVGAAELLHHVDGSATVGELLQRGRAEHRGIDPEQYWELGAQHGYGVEIDWSADAPGCYDVLLTRTGVVPPGATTRRAFIAARVRSATEAHANDPRLRETATGVVAALRDHLQRQLPSYMMPATFVVLDRFPLTENGKVDRRALPPPVRLHTPLASAPPRTATELAIARIWQQALGIDEVGRDENFFEAGGDSLKAVQVIDDINRLFSVRIPVVTIFECPTVRRLAALISTGGPETAHGAATGRARGRQRRAAQPPERRPTGSGTAKRPT